MSADIMADLMVSLKSDKTFITQMKREICIQGLDPQLPEFQGLEKIALAHPSAEERLLWLRTLNPWYKIKDCPGTGRLTVKTGFDGALMPWTVARFHRPNLDAEIIKIDATTTGTILYGNGGKSLVNLQKAAINHYRGGDQYLRYHNAALVIHHFTGRMLQHEPKLDDVERISVIRKRRTDPWAQCEFAIKRYSNPTA